MSYNSNKTFIREIQICLISLCLITIAAGEDQAKSYVKIYKSEKAVLKDLNKDFINLGIHSLINNITYPSLLNYTSADFPGTFVDLVNVTAGGTTFAFNDAYVIFSNSSILSTDPSGSTFIYLSADYNLRNATYSAKGNLKATFVTSDVTYIKEFAKGESGFKYQGSLTLVWKDPQIEFNNPSSPPAGQQLISSAFKETYKSKVKDAIETQLNKELAKYLATQNFNKQLKFGISQFLSSRKMPPAANDFSLNLLKVDAMTIQSKFDLLLIQHFNGYLSGFANRTDLPAEEAFDVKSLDLLKLYNAVFIDKFIFESVVAQAAFKGFFIRQQFKQENVPKALKFDLDIRSVAEVLPEIVNLYSLMQRVQINFALFNPKFDFEDGKTPKIIAQLDFTVYAVNADNKQLNQVFTCQADLAFEISDPQNKNPYLNFNFGIVDVGNLIMSHEFSYVNTDNLKNLIEEFIGYAILQNNVKIFEKDMDLSDLFEEDFEMKYFKGGVLLYNYLN